MSSVIDHAPDPRLQSGAVAAAYTTENDPASTVEPSRRERSDEDENPNAKRARVAAPATQELGVGKGQPDQYGNHPDGRQAIDDIEMHVPFRRSFLYCVVLSRHHSRFSSFSLFITLAITLAFTAGHAPTVETSIGRAALCATTNAACDLKSKVLQDQWIQVSSLAI